MRSVWKTQHEIKDGPQAVRLPMKALPKVVMWQPNMEREHVPCIWWDILNTSGVMADFQVYVFGTGHEIDRDLIYIGTLLQGQLVWHFYFRITRIDYSDTKLKDIPSAGDPL